MIIQTLLCFNIKIGMQQTPDKNRFLISIDIMLVNNVTLNTLFGKKIVLISIENDQPLYITCVSDNRNCEELSYYQNIFYNTHLYFLFYHWNEHLWFFFFFFSFRSYYGGSERSRSTPTTCSLNSAGSAGLRRMYHVTKSGQRKGMGLGGGQVIIHQV